MLVLVLVLVLGLGLGLVLSGAVLVIDHRREIKLGGSRRTQLEHEHRPVASQTAEGTLKPFSFSLFIL